MYCFNCGAKLPQNVKFCPECGTDMSTNMVKANKELIKTASYKENNLKDTEKTTLPYASFAKRVLASLIDQIIVAIIVCIPSALLSIVIIIIVGVIAGKKGLLVGGGEDIASYISGLFQILFGLLTIIGVWSYYTGLESSSQQATYGKRILGLVVTDLDGNRISKSQANTRMFGRLISNFLMGLPYLSALFNTKKQALHDSMSHTVVIEKKRE